MDDLINFNNYTTAERFQIISGILKKASKDCNGAAANRFFEFYFTNYYSLPIELRNDIVYCQRAMKCHLQVHQLIVQVFAQQEDADPIQKNKALRDIEDILYDINAECSFLTMIMREHIDNFCAVFKEHGVNYDIGFTRTMVSKEITQLVCNMQIEIKPNRVTPRQNKNELIRRFFTICQYDAATPAATPANKPEVTETVNISDDDDDDDATVNVPKKQLAQKQSENPLSTEQRAVQQGAIPKKKATSKQVKAAVGGPQTTAAAAAQPKQQQKQQQQKYGATTSKAKNTKQLKSAATEKAVQQPEEAKSDQVRQSRLNFLQVLKRTRKERIQNTEPDNVVGAKSGIKTDGITKQQNKQQQNKQQQNKQSAAQKNQEETEPKTAENDQNTYLRLFGLCTPNEHKRLALAQTQLKRRSYNNNRFNDN